MTLLLISFIAGCLTVLAPCILPLLPVVVGSSAQGRSPYTPYIVILSLGISIIAFTFLLKVSTAFVTVPQAVWTSLSGGILVLFGLTLLFPVLWEKIPGMRKLSVSSNKALGSGYTKKSFWGDVIVGAALGPVFSTCSPTYFVILATVLPASLWLGSLYLLAYVVGLSLMLLLIAIVGERLTSRLGTFADGRGYFKKGLGLLFILIGVSIVMGYEKKIQTAILEQGYFDVTKYEHFLLKKLEEKEDATDSVKEVKTGSVKEIETVTEEVKEVTESIGDVKESPVLSVTEVPTEAVAETKVIKKLAPTPTVALPKQSIPVVSPKQKYVEFVNPSGFVNTDGAEIAMRDFVGKQVILVEVMTYTCINCQRTFPYMNQWYEKYKDDGLTVIGLHTPEFSFEKKIENVEKAMKEFGIQFPIVLDNNYETWNAYNNNFWPRRYLIDIEGKIAYDHIGEGKYAETEAKIVELLKERRDVLGIQ